MYAAWLPYRVRYRRGRALWFHGWRIFLAADGRRTKARQGTRTERRRTMPSRGHGHVWRSWTQWSYSGGGQDSRERNCMDRTCGAAETQYRGHRHDSGTTTTVRGVKIRTCNSCGATL